jgi:hypothetical protein
VKLGNSVKRLKIISQAVTRLMHDRYMFALSAFFEDAVESFQFFLKKILPSCGQNFLILRRKMIGMDRGERKGGKDG